MVHYLDTFNSPSDFAIISVPQLSLYTFVDVRIMSRMRSTARMSPVPSRDSPTAFNIIVIIISPAIGIPAAPIDANNAVIITVNWATKFNSIPYYS